MMIKTIERFRGSLLGLAIGDSLGAPVEFKAPGTFKPIVGFESGGTWGLQAGFWTDDTSMALCLAESLVERKGFDPADQLTRYLRWYREGHLSSTGKCFDIGSATRTALLMFEKTREPYCGVTDVKTAGNGSIMRLAPVPLFFAQDPSRAIELSGESSKTTHRAKTTVDACRYLGGLIVGAVMGIGKETLLQRQYSPVDGYWERFPLCPEIDEIAQGSFKHRNPPEIQGTGYVVKSLEAALWAFYHGDTFRDGVLLAINEAAYDTDTTAAVFGSLAGAYYGQGGIPDDWTSGIAHRDLIVGFAERLAGV